MSTTDKNETTELKRVNKLVLDAGPLITQTSSSLQTYANNFYTTPGVHSELRDEFAKSQLLLWGDSLKIRQPKLSSIKRVTDFSKSTGDYGVLSLNDIHIIALAYEIECEENNGDWRLRKYPGEKKEFKKKHNDNSKVEEVAEEQPKIEEEKSSVSELEIKDEEGWVLPNKGREIIEETDKGTKKPRRRGGKKQRAKREAALEQEEEEEVKEEVSKEVIDEEYNDEDDDGEWITPDNLHEEMMKDADEKISEISSGSTTLIKVALATGDFACQNVSLQMGLNLMNAMSGKRIKRVRNYMLRCHACFRLAPLPKDGTPKHFCSYCGGATLLRCAVSIDSKTGEITPHLKKNFEWHRRGDKYSLASPLSKNSAKKFGHAGYQHNPSKRQEVVLLNEDQKEYQLAIKNDQWQRRQNEKLLEEWIGGGSADNYISPFNSVQKGHGSVKVGRSKFVNSSKHK